MPHSNTRTPLLVLRELPRLDAQTAKGVILSLKPSCLQTLRRGGAENMRRRPRLGALDRASVDPKASEILTLASAFRPLFSIANRSMVTMTGPIQRPAAPLDRAVRRPGCRPGSAKPRRRRE